jgi:hypothetical protein
MPPVLVCKYCRAFGLSASSGILDWNLLSITSLSTGHMPVDSNDFKMSFFMKVKVQACQNNRKKSPFLEREKALAALSMGGELVSIRPSK